MQDSESNEVEQKNSFGLGAFAVFICVFMGGGRRRQGCVFVSHFSLIVSYSMRHFINKLSASTGM